MYLPEILIYVGYLEKHEIFIASFFFLFFFYSTCSLAYFVTAINITSICKIQTLGINLRVTVIKIKLIKSDSKWSLSLVRDKLLPFQ